MKSYTLSDLARNNSAVRHDAARAPVVITERGKPRFVLMAVEDFHALVQRAERPYRLEDMPPEEAELFVRWLDAAIADDADD
ncbi:MAG: type II toxin-antitoxin system Phd/YefM family antitoxin [Caulobacteraceae bacterium]